MSATQSISCHTRGIFLIEPNLRNVRTSSISHISYLKASHLHASPSCGFRQDKLYPGSVYNALKDERCASVHAFGKKGDSISENEPSSWELLKKSTGGLRRELTVQDLLREQMKGTQFNGSGGSGNSFRGGGDGSGGPEGEGFSGQFNELLQVIMATIGVILLYTLITGGEELARLARDYIKYLLGAKASFRLSRTMEKWRKIYESITWKGVV